MTELCQREGIAERLYYSGSKAFLAAGKSRLAGDTARAATSSEVTDLRRAARQLKEVVAEQVLELRLLKKSRLAEGETSNEIPRPPRHWTSSAGSSNPVCRYAERWTSSVSCPRDFTEGTTATSAAGTRR